MSLEQSAEEIGADNEQAIKKERINTVCFPEVTSVKQQIRRIQELISEIIKEPIPSSLSRTNPSNIHSSRGISVITEKRNITKRILKKPPTKTQRNPVIPRSPLDKLRPR